MEEELKEILGEDAEKIEAVKKLVGEKFVPTGVLTERVNKEKENTKKIQELNTQLQKEYDEFKLSKMTEEEQAKELRKRADEDNQKTLKRLNEYVARTIFSQNNVAQEDYESLLDTIISTDEEKTKMIAESICSIINKNKNENMNQIKKQVLQNQPKPEGGNDNTNGITSKLEMYQQKLKEAKEKNDIVKIATYTRLVQEENMKK
mgnify:CR=1 FL=1